MKTKLYLALAVALCLTLIVSSPALAKKSYLADRYDVTIAVQPDGLLNITETIVFRFTGGPFTYVFRELAFNHLDAIDNIQASLDGQALAQGTQPGQVEITTGKPIKVTWHFAPAQDAVHEFTLTYRIKGAIRQDAAAADTLIWRAIPAEHEYTINQGRIRIEYPAGVLPITPPSLSVTGAGFEASAASATFTLKPIDADTPVDITVSFPSHSLVSQPPAWQAEQQQQAQRTSMGLPFGLGAAAITTLLGVMGVILARRSFRRHSNSFQNAYQNVAAPPRAISPALAAKLTGSSVPFLGTLFDLARRGMLRIEEGPKKWGSRTFEVIRQSTSERLLPHEQVFLDALFHKAKKERVDFSEIGPLAYNSQFSQALDQELTTAGWRDAERSSQRGRFLAGATLALVIGLCIFFAGLLIGGLLHITDPKAVILGAILMGLGVALSGVGLVALIVAVSISSLSDEGARQASAWNSFTGYLRNITRGREPVAYPDLFERYLPYAAGLGLATEWAKYFQKQANVPIPAWFMGLQSGVDDGSFIAIMAAISAADSAASVATGADGGGASGGGSSGAG